MKVKIPYVSKTLLLDILIVLDIIACIWARERNLVTLDWILCVLLLVLSLLRWPWNRSRL